MKAGGSLPRGRRLLDEVPEVPARSGLTGVQRRAQDHLVTLVDEAGGRLQGGPIPSDPVDALIDLFEEWARIHGVKMDYGIYFDGRPGLWRALDELCPLQDPNRWDRLRESVIKELEARNWKRRSKPRGSAFDILI